jgi:hypothetical protein
VLRADTPSVARRLLVLPLLAALLFLPGCFWWLAPMTMYDSGSESSSSPAEEVGMTTVRAAIPAIEAYYADNGTYKGARLELLRERYDASLQGIKIVRANDQTYCIESTPDLGLPWHKAGPAADIVPGDCNTPALAPPPQTDAEMCIETTIDGVPHYQVGPAGPIQPGRCPTS